MKKEVNGIQTEKEVKLLLFADDMILCIEYPKDATRILLELINNLLKLKNTKLIQRNLLHFCTLTMKYQKEQLRKQSHLPSHKKE